MYDPEDMDFTPRIEHVVIEDGRAVWRGREYRARCDADGGDRRVLSDTHGDLATRNRFASNVWWVTDPAQTPEDPPPAERPDTGGPERRSPDVPDRPDMGVVERKEYPHEDLRES